MQRKPIRRLTLRLLLLVAVAATASMALAQPAGGGAAPADAPRADAPRADADADQTKKTEEMSILQLFVKGGWFMIPIAACSLLAVTVIIERFLALQRSRIVPPGFIERLQSVYRDGSGRKEAMDYCRTHDNPTARVALAGLRKVHRGEKAVEEAVEDAGSNEISKLRRNLRMLYAIAAVAPMLGLLGTVWGMIQAFQVASQQGLGRATSLAKGIYEALVTTFGGLIVAIPVLIFYYYFLGKIERIVHEMNDLSVELIEGTLVLETPAPQVEPPATPKPVTA